MTPSKKKPKASDLFTWRSLTLVNLYRVLLASGLVLLFGLFPDVDSDAAQTNLKLCFYISISYWFFAAAALYIRHVRLLGFISQVFLFVAGDIAALSLLLLYGDQFITGFGLLLTLSIASSSLMVRPRHALLFAATATITTLGQSAVNVFNGSISYSEITQNGLLGIALFVAAMIPSYLAKAARENEALAKQQQVDLRNLEKLNEEILQRMDAGLVVVDESEHIQLHNHAAIALLTNQSKLPTGTLSQVSSKLSAYLQVWKANPDLATPAISVKHRPGKIQARFQSLDPQTTLILLDDASRQTQKAQQQKLASLGRLTASIAHEIRNPLGAISHATQLLGESEEVSSADKRLLEIIENHTARLNDIIESIMGMSRQSAPAARRIKLKLFANQLIEEMRHNPDFRDVELHCQCPDNSTQIWFDTIHLHQIVSNLITNAVRYGIKPGHTLRIEVEIGRSDTGNPYLAVTDNGPGVPKNNQDHLFEPFFTTSKSGSGLGLYLSKALCEANQASLRYDTKWNSGARFIIMFALTEKPQEK